MEVSGDCAAVEEGCRTPRRGGFEIPAPVICPPAPRKKVAHVKQRNPPKNGYFQPPDLEALFAIAPGQFS
ncbi:hypothetical protein Acr_03g0003730 [Actinidia rufa]|uniref:Uncharacterized protein n=1 Tax=Actinidia rufa TaxID=165716 RepID=A0A7J0ECL5_9ERIC|nr:hypothetical protein Acr_03g0003730 [Actinidia rufa]